MFFSSLALAYLYVGGGIVALCGLFDWWASSNYPRIQFGERKHPELWIHEVLETARSMYE
jgi:O-acetylhomoserine/O-acetylserine sulfhydrylase-like pyridoxal-dependent enzyme